VERTDLEEDARPAVIPSDDEVDTERITLVVAR
jgi:hypothetical protein